MNCSKSQTEYPEYQNSLKVYRDLKNSIDTAFDDGKAEGKAEGLAEGIEKGIRLTAQKFKLEGLPVEMIAKVTGLMVEEIEQLDS